MKKKAPIKPASKRVTTTKKPIPITKLPVKKTLPPSKQTSKVVIL